MIKVAFTMYSIHAYNNLLLFTFLQSDLATGEAISNPFITGQATSTPVLVVSTETSQNVFSFGNSAQAQVNIALSDSRLLEVHLLQSKEKEISNYHFFHTLGDC